MDSAVFVTRRYICLSLAVCFLSLFSIAVQANVEPTQCKQVFSGPVQSHDLLGRVKFGIASYVDRAESETIQTANKSDHFFSKSCRTKDCSISNMPSAKYIEPHLSFDFPSNDSQSNIAIAENDRAQVGGGDYNAIQLGSKSQLILTSHVERKIKSINLGAGSQLVLGAGTYWVSSLVAEPDSEIIIDAEFGAVFLYLEGDPVLDVNVHFNRAGDASELFVFSYADFNLAENSRNNLLAYSRGKTTLHDGADVWGAVSGSEVELKVSSTITYHSGAVDVLKDAYQSCSGDYINDADGDGVADYRDLDADNDQISDEYEIRFSTNPLDSADKPLDVNGNKVPDLAENKVNLPNVCKAAYSQFDNTYISDKKGISSQFNKLRFPINNSTEDRHIIGPSAVIGDDDVISFNKISTNNTVIVNFSPKENYYIKEFAPSLFSTVNMPPGNYWIENLVIHNNNTWNVIGDGTVRLFVKNIFSTGAFVNLNATETSFGDPGQFFIYSFDKFVISNSSRVSAHLYARNTIGVGAFVDMVGARLAQQYTGHLQTATPFSQVGNVDFGPVCDFDGDGIYDGLDLDLDNDGFDNINDTFPLNPNENIDTDGDGTGNNADNDDDGDGFSDEEELLKGTDPLDPNDYPCDFDAPVVSVLSPEVYTYAESLTLEAEVVDAGGCVTGVKSVVVRNLSATFSGTMSLVSGNNYSIEVPLDVGDNGFIITATDHATNEGLGHALITRYPPDTVAPSISWLNPISTTYANSVELELNVVDGGDVPSGVQSVTVEIGGSSYSATLGAGNLYRATVNLSLGDNALSIKAVDNQNNEQFFDAVITRLPPDVLGPEITWLNSQVETYKERLGLEFEVVDLGDLPSGVELVKAVVLGRDYSAAVVVGNTYRVELDLTVGQQVITINAIDKAGNESDLDISVTRLPPDTAPPALNLIDAISETESAQIAVRVEVVDGGEVPAGVEAVVVEKEGALVMAMTLLDGNVYSANLDLEVGSHNFDIRATDRQGNSSKIGFSVERLPRDEQAPEIVLITLGGTTTEPLVSVEANIFDAGAVTSGLNLDSIAVHRGANLAPIAMLASGDNKFVAQLPLELGSNNFEIRAADNKNNGASQAISFTRIESLEFTALTVMARDAENELFEVVYSADQLPAQIEVPSAQFSIKQAYELKTSAGNVAQNPELKVDGRVVSSPAPERNGDVYVYEYRVDDLSFGGGTELALDMSLTQARVDNGSENIGDSLSLQFVRLIEDPAAPQADWHTPVDGVVAATSLINVFAQLSDEVGLNRVELRLRAADGSLLSTLETRQLNGEQYVDYRKEVDFAGLAADVLGMPSDQLSGAAYELELLVENIAGLQASSRRGLSFGFAEPELQVFYNGEEVVDSFDVEGTEVTISGEVTDAAVSSVLINNQSVSLQATSDAEVSQFSFSFVLSPGAQLPLDFVVSNVQGKSINRTYVANSVATTGIKVIAPVDGLELTTNESGLAVNTVARLTGFSADAGDAVEVSVGSESAVLDVSGDLANGTIALPNASGEYDVVFKLIKAGGEIKQVVRRVKVIALEEVELQVVKITPSNSGDIDSTDSFEIFFSKPVEQSRVKVTLLESYSGKKYVNADRAGESFINQQGYVLQDVAYFNSEVAAKSSFPPGNTMLGLYPAKQLAFGAKVELIVGYQQGSDPDDIDELARQTFSVRRLPTILQGLVNDQFDQPLDGLTIHLSSTRSASEEPDFVAVSERDGGFAFGFDDSSKSLIGGEYWLEVNPGLANSNYGNSRQKIVLADKRKNDLARIIVQALSPDIPYQRISSGTEVELAAGALKLDLTDAELDFGKQRRVGAVHTQFVTLANAGASIGGGAIPLWLYSNHPRGVGVDGQVGIEISVPAYRGSHDYIKGFEYVVLLAFNPDYQVVEPVGVGKVVGSGRQTKVVSETAAAVKSLDYFAFAIVSPEFNTLLKDVAEGSRSMDELKAVLP